jgi:serine/threonine protein kinase
MLFGVPPFDANDEKIICKKIKMNSYKFPDNIKVDPSAKKLISSLLNLDPSKRPSLDAIVEHDFFKIYHSIPLILPLSTLSCPLSQKYISEFLKNDNVIVGKNNMNNQNFNNNDYDIPNFGRNKENEMTNKNEYMIENDTNLNFDQDLKKFGDDDNMKSRLNIIDLNNNYNNIPPDKRYFCIRISKYFDYSSKFGFVYFINNTHIGICFNDFSNILKLMPQNKNEKTEYLYYEKDEQQATHLSEVELNNYLKNESTSRDIIKKYEIFKRIVEKHKNDFEEIQESKNNFINILKKNNLK